MNPMIAQRHRPFFLLSLLAACIVAGVAWAQTSSVFVKRGEVGIRSGTGLNDPEIARVRQGDQLTVLAREGARLRVRTPQGQQGFIAAINVTDVPPTGAGRPVVLRDDTRVGQRQGAGAIRGLTPAAEQYARDEGIPQEAIEAVRAMELLGDGIHLADVDRFRSEGRIVAP